MAFLERPCPVCNSHANNLLYQCIDYSVSKEKFNLVKCATCSMVYTNPIPDESEIGRYYKTQDYISHTDTRKGLIHKLYHLVRKRTLQKKNKLITRLNDGKVGSVLDVGCGTGHFLTQCKNSGWKIQGTEPDEDANRIARDLTGEHIHHAINEVIGSEIFDIITLWHVLEHVHQLKETLDRIHSFLKKTGYLMIAVPNLESLDAAIYKENWAAFDVPRHLYHFSKSSMVQLMGNHGFRLHQIIPMIFDSYYVSLMSEKNINSNTLTGMCKATINGFRSNLAGNNNQSSLIYIFHP
jgi:2-polyprenyl-3-methyl-5-hydroxy-6-metoxy-1,4-benzoquinol methylase